MRVCVCVCAHRSVHVCVPLGVYVHECVCVCVRYRALQYLAESRRAGGELADLHMFIVISVLFLLRVHMMIPV